MLFSVLIKSLIENGEKYFVTFLSYNLLFPSGISPPCKISSISQNKVAFYLKAFHKCGKRSLNLGGGNLTNGFLTQTISTIENDGQLCQLFKSNQDL